MDDLAAFLLIALAGLLMWLVTTYGIGFQVVVGPVQ